MRKLFLAIMATLSLPALANSLQFDNLSKKDFENVVREFGANFSHTAVAAPETEGVWGIEVGIIGGSAGSPKLKGVVNDAGGDGSDFKNLYHAGLMARAHFPFDLFAEVTLLPEREISDVDIKNKTIGIGWNLGSFFILPLDVAVGLNYSSADVSFTQTSPIASEITLNAKALVYWAGVSKTFAFVTPYAKAGIAKIDGELDTTASILAYTASKKEKVSASGGYLALGANLQIFFARLGLEFSQTADVKRVSGKLAVAF